MPEVRIDISELKNEGSDVVKDLATFLEEKTSSKVETGTSEITVKIGEEEKISRTYLRVLLRKFLHRSELKDHYRITSGKEGTFVVKEKKTAEEEE